MEAMAEETNFFVYILKCSDGTLYTGWTTNVEKRVQANNSPQCVTKYTRVRQPVRLVYQEACASRSDAQKREVAIKKLSREEKLEVIKNVQ